MYDNLKHIMLKIRMIGSLTLIVLSNTVYSQPKHTNCQYLLDKSSPAFQQLRLRDFGKAYKKMRVLNSVCLRYWESDLYVAMDELKNELGSGRYSLRRLEHCMGVPDTIIDARRVEQGIKLSDNVLAEAVTKIKENQDIVYHIYFWRSWHDYLYFVTTNNQIVKADWYFAYE